MDGHLERAEPTVQTAFAALSEWLDQLGPYELVAVKTMVLFRSGSNFGGASFGRWHLDVSFILSRRLDHPRVLRVERMSATKFSHRVRVTSVEDVDSELTQWLTEAYHFVTESSRGG